MRSEIISVCMATYNGERYIKEQIDSILLQLGEADELIISDDGSSDSTIKIIESYSDNRIKLSRFNSHDYTRNFENALMHANGDIIFLSDQDDIWFNDKIEKMLNYFKEYSCDLVISDAAVVDKDCNVTHESYFKACGIKKGFFNNWIKTRYIGSCMALKRKLLKYLLPIPGESKYIAHDYWIACFSEKNCKIGLLDEPLMYYRRHGGNASSGIQDKSNNSLLFKIYKRLYIMICLLIRKYDNK